MPTNAELNARAFADIVSAWSDRLPAHDATIDRRDLTQCDVAIVMRNEGGGQFINDALSERDLIAEDNDGFDILARRLLMGGDRCTAAVGCGLTVDDFVYRHAAKIIERAVTALRDSERPTKYDAAWNEADRYFAYEPRGVTA